MKIKLLTAAVAALLLASGIEASAQGPYAYGTSIDIQAGYAVSPYLVNGDKRLALGLSDGAILDLRVTHFFGRHFGGFAQIGIAETSSKYLKYFDTVNRADGGRYQYEPGSSMFAALDLAPILLLGPVWRQDAGNWSFRYRLGLGAADVTVPDMEYARYDRGSGTPTFVNINIARKYADYMYDEYYDMDLTSGRFVLSPSVQMNYSPIPHFHLSAEVGANIIPARVDVCTTTTQGKKISDTDGWREAVDYFFSYLSDYVTDSSTSQVRIDNMSIGSVIYLTFGIGWDIGFNRNHNGYYHRR